MNLSTYPNQPEYALAEKQEHLSAIITYSNLSNNWDEHSALAPTQATVLAALELAHLLTEAGQAIYHTAPGPNGEIMINLRNGDKSVEFLVYPDGRNNFVRIGPDDAPQQGVLITDYLPEILQWLNE